LKPPSIVFPDNKPAANLVRNTNFGSIADFLGSRSPNLKSYSDAISFPASMSGSPELFLFVKVDLPPPSKVEIAELSAPGVPMFAFLISFG